MTRRGKYLGFMIGPGKADESWIAPAAKFMARVRLWENQPLGLQYDALVYNTFAIPVLGYIAQLETPPEWLLTQEREAPRKAAKGPGGWAVPDDLWRL